MAIAPGQLVKSVVGIACGAGLGVFCWAVLDYGYGWAIFIGAVGSFIGFALTLPGVSASRVAGATSGMIIGYDPVNGGSDPDQAPAQDAQRGGRSGATPPDPQREPRPWDRPRG
ncbi:unnamed protein product [Gemmataceae bacterium]|nr:unnamed protein product [Gemmataceae bacterium]VTT97580.1 unnamed protein product [Gemmataceae bacterium]